MEAGYHEPGLEDKKSGFPSNDSASGAEFSVDAKCTVEVDLGKYPKPMESTKKIRGKSDFVEWFLGPINRELLIAKAFYFFFFSAFGSLLPLMAIYFKNMGMTPTQAGILIGIRPFVGYLSAPLWADIADRLRQGKVILVCSIAAWIIFNVPLGFIRPSTTSCLVYNGSKFFIELPDAKSLVKRNALESEFLPSNFPYENLENSFDTTPSDFQETWISTELDAEDSWSSSKLPGSIPEDLQFLKSTPNSIQDLLEMEENTERDIQLEGNRLVRVRRHFIMKPTHQIGKSPYTIEFAENYNPRVHSTWVSPAFSFTIFELEDIRKVFFLSLLLIVIGEFFCCPSITLADSAVLNMLGKENADQYGRQRMFASIGWGLTMFFICLGLDHSHTFTNHPCPVHVKERNYTICYACFTVFMSITMIIATRLPFSYASEQAENSGMSCQASNGSLFSLHQNNGYTSPTGPWTTSKPPRPPPPVPGQNHKSTEVISDVLKHLLGKSKVFAQTTRQIPEWLPVLRHFANPKCASFMFVAWFMGFGIGLIFTFLFWHLQDYGGTSSVFGLASVVNHISEMLAYFLSYPLIRKIGHIKVLCLGLFGNVLRFIYISYIQEPWGVMPFELIQGITHSAVWAASCSYIAHNTPQELRASAQGVLTFVHNGLGRSCGTIFGGLFATYYGTTAVLRGYGFACIVVLILFILVMFYNREKGFKTSLTPTEDPHQVAERMAHLAPHGVPGNPVIPRSPSSVARMANRNNTSNRSFRCTSNGSLDVPSPNGATNPFLSDLHDYNHSMDDYGGITIIAPFRQED